MFNANHTAAIISEFGEVKNAANSGSMVVREVTDHVTFFVLLHFCGYIHFRNIHRDINICRNFYKV